MQTISLRINCQSIILYLTYMRLNELDICEQKTSLWILIIRGLHQKRKMLALISTPLNRYEKTNGKYSCCISPDSRTDICSYSKQQSSSSVCPDKSNVQRRRFQ